MRLIANDCALVGDCAKSDFEAQVVVGVVGEEVVNTEPRVHHVWQLGPPGQAEVAIKD